MMKETDNKWFGKGCYTYKR